MERRHLLANGLDAPDDLVTRNDGNRRVRQLAVDEAGHADAG